MPRVPLYDQNQLASQLVATPGVDKSSVALFAGIAETAESVGNTVYGLQAAEYQQQQVELRRQQAEVRAAEKELHTMKRSAEVSGMASGFSVKLNTLNNELQKRDTWNTDNTLKDFNDQARAWAEEELENETDPIKKAMAQKAYNEVITSQTNGLSDWAKSRTLPIIDSSIKAMAGDLTAKLKDSTVGDWVSANKTLEEYDKQLPIYETLYGKEGLTKLRADQDAALKQRVASIANGDNPKELETLDKNPVVRKYMDPTTFHGFLKDQRIVASQRERELRDEQRRQETADNLEANTAWIGLTTNGDPRSINAADYQSFRGSQAWNKLKPAEQKMLERAQQGADEYLKAESEKQRKAASKQQAPFNDKAIMTNLGRQVQHTNNLYNSLQKSYGAMIQKGHRITDAERVKLTGQLEAFQQAHMDTIRLRKSLQTPEAQDVADTHLTQVQSNLDNVMKLLRSKGQYGRAAYGEIQYRGQVKAKVGYDNPYSNRQKAAMYNFYYNSRFNEEFDKAAKAGKSEDLRLNKPVKQPDGKTVGAADALRWRLRKFAAEQVERAWGNRGR